MDAPPPPNASAWLACDHKTLLHTRVFDVRSTRFEHPVRKVQRDFVVIDPPDWVNVIAVTADQQMVLVRQFRYGISGFSWEIPGGVIEKNEAPAAGGMRELREETGYVGSTAQVLGSVHPNPAIQSNRCHFLFVEDATLTSGVAWDHDEEIDVCLVHVEDVFTMARSGLITHSLVLNALFLFEPLWRTAQRV
ncbi:MAG: NUDIX hydrolase [Opitutus sp.]